MAEVRAGPDSQEVEDLRLNESERDVTYRNQCLFMETLSATLDDDLWNKVSLESGLLSVQETTHAPSSSLTVSTPGNTTGRSADSSGGSLSSASQPSSSQSGPTKVRPNIQFEEVVTSLVRIIYLDS